MGSETLGRKLAGLRVTSQRALILEIIRQGEGHLDADEVYRRARDKQPRLNLSTVYRTLRLFKKLGLVEELHFDEAHHHYEVKPAAEHHHLVCLGCGRIIEFHYPLSRYLKKNVAEAKDFDIIETEVRMSGYCIKCRQSQK
ncbi:transcriptional repressor [Dehalococcoidales bacterium]|nr:transcriptional repressor [Dehalococcoidales bacterium]